jgi:hypothetical protein
MRKEQSGVPDERAHHCDVVFAILAHDNAACLAQQMEILKAFTPGSQFIVFDASSDGQITREIGIKSCQGSRPLKYGRLAPFHLAAMRAAATLGDYGFLITLDSDMLLIKSGLTSYLRRVMKDSEYMASHFQEVRWWLRSDSHRRFLYSWRQHWQSLLGTSRPYRVFNCFQVFRRELVTRILALKGIDEIVEATESEHTSHVALEEIIYPTLAVRLCARPIPYPGSFAISTDPVLVSDLVALRDDPRVVFVHSGKRDLASPVWRFVRALSLGVEMPQVAVQEPRSRRTVMERVRSLIHRLRGDALVLVTILRNGRY